MQVLEDLYLGDIHPSERSFKKGSQYAKALNNVVKVGDAFSGSLTEKQKEQFEGKRKTITRLAKSSQI